MVTAMNVLQMLIKVKVKHIGKRLGLIIAPQQVRAGWCAACRFLLKPPYVLCCSCTHVSPGDVHAVWVDREREWAYGCVYSRLEMCVSCSSAAWHKHFACVISEQHPLPSLSSQPIVLPACLSSPIYQKLLIYFIFSFLFIPTCSSSLFSCLSLLPFLPSILSSSFSFYPLTRKQVRGTDLQGLSSPLLFQSPSSLAHYRYLTHCLAHPQR